MSHIVTIRTQVRDRAAIAAACQRLGLPAPVEGTARLYSTSARGTIVRLPGWQFPVVCQVDTGELRYDNYNGAWGSQARLDGFLQAYAVEKARLEARKAGYVATEQRLPDGSIKLTLTAGGAT